MVTSVGRQQSSLPGRPITRAPALARDQVAEYLRDGITSLRFAAGTPLIEREICEATTASRTTVREALRQLEAEGLVEVGPGRGIFVKQLSRREVLEIYAVRAQLEGLVCQLFAENSTAEQRAALREAMAEMSKYFDDPMRMLHEKEVFYAVLYEGAGNLEVERLLRGLSRRIKLGQASTLNVPGRPAQSLHEMGLIVDAIDERNGDSPERGASRISRRPRRRS